MALIKVTLPTALPTARQMIGELGKAVKETGGLPGLETVSQSLDALDDYASRKALDVEVVVVAPVAADQASRVAAWIGAGFPAPPLQARTVEPTIVELPGGPSMVPLRARVRSLTTGAAVAAGTPRPAVLILLVGSPTALHPENMAALEGLLEDRPSVVVVGPPEDPLVKQLDERAKATAWTALLGDVPEKAPETSFQARLSVAPWDQAHDLFRAHSTVIALESLCGVFDITLQQQARDLRTKKAATQAKIGKPGPGGAKAGPQGASDLIPEIKTRIQRHSQEFERGAVERLQDLLGLAAGSLSRETEAMLLALDELEEKEGTTKIECRIPPAFEQKLIKTIRERVAHHCAADVVALNDLFRLLAQEIERTIAQEQGPPFVPHFAYLTEDRVRRMMDMSVAFQAQYRGEMPHHGFSEYFASVRKYSMILVMAASMFGMSSVMRQYREFTVPLTIVLVLGGTYSVISSTRQQRVEYLEKELEAARTALRPDLKRIFSEVQKAWSTILIQHMNEQIANVLAEVDTAVKDFQARRGAEASPEKERLTRQLAQLDMTEKKLALPLKAKEGIAASLAQLRGDLKPLLPKPGAPGAAKPAAAAAAASAAGAPSSAVLDAKAKIEALKAQAAGGRPAVPGAKPAAPAGPAQPSALDEAKAKFAALRAGAAKPAGMPAPTPGAPAKPAVPAAPAKPSAMEEAKAKFEALKAQAAARAANPPARPTFAVPPKPAAAPPAAGAPARPTATPAAAVPAKPAATAAPAAPSTVAPKPGPATAAAPAPTPTAPASSTIPKPVPSAVTPPPAAATPVKPAGPAATATPPAKPTPPPAPTGPAKPEVPTPGTATPAVSATPAAAAPAAAEPGKPAAPPAPAATPATPSASAPPAPPAASEPAKPAAAEATKPVAAPAPASPAPAPTPSPSVPPGSPSATEAAKPAGASAPASIAPAPAPTPAPVAPPASPAVTEQAKPTAPAAASPTPPPAPGTSSAEASVRSAAAPVGAAVPSSPTSPPASPPAGEPTNK